MEKVFILQDMTTGMFLVFKTQKAALKEYKSNDCIFCEGEHDKDFRTRLRIYPKFVFKYT